MLNGTRMPVSDVFSRSVDQLAKSKTLPRKKTYLLVVLQAAPKSIYMVSQQSLTVIFFAG